MVRHEIQDPYEWLGKEHRAVQAAANLAHKQERRRVLGERLGYLSVLVLFALLFAGIGWSIRSAPEQLAESVRAQANRDTAAAFIVSTMNTGSAKIACNGCTPAVADARYFATFARDDWDSGSCSHPDGAPLWTCGPKARMVYLEHGGYISCGLMQILTLEGRWLDYDSKVYCWSIRRAVR